LFVYKAIPGRHLSTPRAVLDDDPAILCDASEDGIEGFTALASLTTTERAHGSLTAWVPLGGLIAHLGVTHAATIDFLCRYQC